MSRSWQSSRLDPVDLLVGTLILGIPFTGNEFTIAGISPTDSLLVVTTLMIGLRILFKGTLSLSRVQLVALSCFTIVIVIAFLSSVTNDAANRPLITYLGYYLLLFLLLVYIDSRSRVKLLMNIWFIGAVIISVLTIFSSVLGIEMGQSLSSGRTVGPVTLPIYRTIGVDLTYGEYGMYILATAPHFALKGFLERKITPLAGVSLILFSAFFSSQSRSTWLAVAGGFGALLFIFTTYYRSSSKRFGRYLLMILVSIAIIGSRKIASLIIHVNEAAYLIRLAQYRTSLEVLLNNPIFGLGLGNLEQFPLNVVPHNAFLYIGVFLGLPAMLLVVMIFMTGVIHLTRCLPSGRSDDYLVIGLLTGLIAVLIEAQFVGGFGRTGWAIIAICLSVPPETRSNKLYYSTDNGPNEIE